MKNKAFLALLLSFCVFLPALAQTKPASPQQPQKPSDDQDEVVKINTNLVQVDAVVTKDGKVVTNLTADDFEVYEDGKKRPIYSVDTAGLQVTGLTAADSFYGTGQQYANLIARRLLLLWSRREGSDLIAKQTGGFQVKNSNKYELDRIVQDQSGYYLLGYRPTAETFNRKFHHIKAKVTRSGMTLRTRLGFFGVTEEEASKTRLTTRDMTNLALMSPFTAQDVQVGLASFFWSDKTSGSLIRNFVYVDAGDLVFTPVDGRHQASIEVHGVVLATGILLLAGCNHRQRCEG